MYKKANRNMSKYYQEKRMKDFLKQDVYEHKNQSFSVGYLNEFNQGEKVRIFNEACSCISMFYKIIDDKDE